MSIKNETVYNSELIDEAAKILMKKYKCIVAGAVIILAAMACYFGATIRASSRITVIVIPIIGMVAVLLVGIFRITGYKKMLSQRLRVLNHNDEIKCSYEIDNEKTVIASPSGKNTLYHKDIKKINETKAVYLIIYSGAVFAMISKEGFIEGTEDQFRSVFNFKES